MPSNPCILPSGALLLSTGYWALLFAHPALAQRTPSDCANIRIVRTEEDPINLRASPSLSAAILSSTTEGKSYQVFAVKKGDLVEDPIYKDDSTSTWYEVRTSKGTPAWVSGTYADCYEEDVEPAQPNPPNEDPPDAKPDPKPSGESCKLPKGLKVNRLTPILAGRKQQLLLMTIDRDRAEIDLKPAIDPSRTCKGTSKLGQSSGALAAINGTFFACSKSRLSTLQLKIDGEMLYRNEKTELTRGVFGTTANGTPYIREVKSSDPLTKLDQVIGGIPMLISKGRINWQRSGSVIGSGNGGGESFQAQRTARTVVGIGCKNGSPTDGSCDRKRIFLLVADGGGKLYPTGLPIKDLAEFMLQLGVVEALNLDGGGSTTAWIKGCGVVNEPSKEQPERAVGSILGLYPK